MLVIAVSIGKGRFVTGVSVEIATDSASSASELARYKCDDGLIIMSQDDSGSQFDFDNAFWCSADTEK